MKKTIGLFVLSILLSQSCVVYEKTQVPIDQATNVGRVKVINESGMEYKFRNIELEEGVYIGVLKDASIVLHNPDTLELFLKNKTSSNWLTVGLLIPAAVVVVVGLVFLSWAIFGPLI